MPAFDALPKQDIDAVISYIVHLAIRGECEYTTMVSFLREENEEDAVADELVLNLKTIAPRWVNAEKTPIKVEPDPFTTPDERLRAAASGYALFHTTGGCVACHREYGKNAPFIYDSWAGINRARNLTLGVMRGGRDDESIYRRLYGGIAGSNMPAQHQTLQSTPADLEKGRHKLWELVHFVKTMGDPYQRRLLAERYGLPELNQ